MQQQLDDIQRDVKAMKDAMLGTEYGQKGLVDRVEKNESYIDKDKKHKWVGLGIMLAIGTIAKYWDKIFH